MEIGLLQDSIQLYIQPQGICVPRPAIASSGLICTWSSWGRILVLRELKPSLRKRLNSIFKQFIKSIFDRELIIKQTMLPLCRRNIDSLSSISSSFANFGVRWISALVSISKKIKKCLSPFYRLHPRREMVKYCGLIIPLDQSFLVRIVHLVVPGRYGIVERPFGWTQTTRSRYRSRYWRFSENQVDR